MEYWGTIVGQKFVDTFQWNGKDYHRYLISFKEHEGVHLLNRCVEYEQALIGAEIMFDYSSEKSKITRYKVLKYIPIEELQKNSQ
jgi:hypothetical protein